ncbi:hypothetical protein C798_20075 [Herbaspirillum rubrisubalbicans Os34]|uniref:IclR-ED domain-containing protein n=1 Tax=Herbaspirillum rubrisubalbicans Os34 TaxID=1235827 RepID=A0A6M3ZUX7_9BURK|nr:hypothetical protein C798_20075 [Herbaspirillum rubrisubalbicans Os34]
MHTAGMTAMAAPIMRPGYPAIGVINIAAPLMRLDLRLMESLGADHLTAAKELANNSSSSPIFNRAVLK